VHDARLVAQAQLAQRFVGVGELRHCLGTDERGRFDVSHAAAISASMICALTALAMSTGSDWNPSRVPTSVIDT
jgi:hypothetical protein